MLSRTIRTFRAEIKNNILYTTFIICEKGTVIQFDVYKKPNIPFVEAMDSGQLGMTRYTAMFDDLNNKEKISLKFDRLMSRPSNSHERLLCSIKKYLIEHIMKNVDKLQNS